MIAWLRDFPRQWQHEARETTAKGMRAPAYRSCQRRYDSGSTLLDRGPL